MLIQGMKYLPRPLVQIITYNDRLFGLDRNGRLWSTTILDEPGDDGAHVTTWTLEEIPLIEEDMVDLVQDKAA